MDIQSPIYILHIYYLNDQSDKIKHRCYVQGIPVCEMNFTNVASLQIERIYLESNRFKKESLTKYFYAFQKFIKLYATLLRRVRNPRFILDRERLGCNKRLLWLPPIGTLYPIDVSTSGST